MRDASKRFANSGWHAAVPALQSGQPLAAYSEEDDAATQLLETLLGEQKWLVQITPYDRRFMDTAELVSETQKGRLVARETLVWRGGMLNWLPIAEVPALPFAGPAAAPAPRLASFEPSPSSKPFKSFLAWAAVVLMSISLTICGLALGGVFDAPNGARAPTPDGTRSRNIRPDKNTLPQRPTRLVAQSPDVPFSARSE
jgi:uncharacterized protein DUF4339